MYSCKISVIVLTFRKFDNLENNLRSIKGQTFQDYEVIIQDDGSDNFDADAVMEMCRGIRSFRIFHSEQNNGTVKNYNLAIDRARGEYIVPLSQDDVFFDSTALASIYDAFQFGPYNVLLGKMVGRKSGSAKPSEYDLALLKSGNLKDIWLRCAYANCISGAALYYKRAFLLEKGGFDEEALLIEDHSMVMNLLNQGIAITVMNQATVLYGEDGVTGSYYHPSSAIVKDNVLIYRKYIIPCLEKLGSKFNRRIISWRRARWESYSNNRRLRLAYLDVYVWLALTGVVCKVFRERDCTALRCKLMLKNEVRCANHRS